MIKSSVKKAIAKVRDNSFRYLFLLACLTCASIGWTSARYTSDIYASPESARTAEFSYEIDHTVYKINQDGEVLERYDLKPQSWQTSSRVFQYNVNTGDDTNTGENVKEKVRVDFKITLKTEVAMRFTMEKERPPERPLIIEQVKLTGEGISEITVNNPDPEILTPLTYDIYPTDGEVTYTCSVTLRHDGEADYNPNPGEGGTTIGYEADRFMNLVPRFTQID